MDSCPAESEPSLQAPRSLRNLIGPDPRTVEREQWAKFLWAAMNLEAEDLPTTGSNVLVYPLEMVRAIAVVWCFAALDRMKLSGYASGVSDGSMKTCWCQKPGRSYQKTRCASWIFRSTRR